MGSLFSRAARNLTAERRYIGNTFGDSSILPNSASMTLGASGQIMNESAAMGVATVFSCAKVIVNDIGILPFFGWNGEKAGVKMLASKQPVIVTQPFGPDLSVQAGMGQIVYSLVMRGNAFLYPLQHDHLGYPTMLQILHPDHVQVRRDPKTGVKYYIVDSVRYEADEIYHIIFGPSAPGSDVGLDPISFMKLTLGWTADMRATSAALFRNGTMVGGVISVEGPGDRKKAREIKETFEAGHAGVANAHRPAVLFGGATWTPMAIPPDNAQFLQTLDFSREEITGWFGVPLQRIQAGNQKAVPAKGADTIDQGYATHTLLPITTAIEGVWDNMIPGGQKTFARFDFSGLLRASASERAVIAQIHRVATVRTPNEIRADEGLGPIDGGDNIFAPLNSNTSGAAPGDNTMGEGPDATPDNGDEPAQPATAPPATPSGGTT